MDFYLLDVHSTVIAQGQNVAFDYTNTYLDPDVALKEARQKSQDPNVLKAVVHHWVLKADGTQEPVINENVPDILYYYLNNSYRGSLEQTRLRCI